ncbi:MAG: type I-E CRISPR-associated protein Cse1/CasA [Ruminococcus sp.]|nr:type I-E CRISPR-associated protein Cse1/CasA [Ruminococcus sp.]
MEREFCLITEPWIKVMKADKTVKEVSLLELFSEAHEYVCLAGETKSQDFAVLRFLLAVIYTVFSRYDENGDETDPDDDDYDPVDLWKKVWSAGKMPTAPFEKYFDKWQDRFWLFDEEYPFYQSKAVKGKSKPISTGKLIGSLFESANKPRLFSDRTNDGRELSCSEAARWLLHIVNFDDIAAKQPTPKKTWCGKLGLIAVRGKNLFETLMLNYVADCDDEKTELPSWETDDSRDFNKQISVPSNQAAMLSLRSRKVLLCRENDTITGYYLAGGDYFENEDVPDELMTIWRGYKEKKDSVTLFRPARHDASKTAWQEFGAIAAFPDSRQKEKDNADFGIRAPGVLRWVSGLKKYLGKNYMLNIETASVVYDLGQATSLPVIDVISDRLSFHLELLEELGAGWRRRINDEIDKCEQAAKKVSALSINLQTASGASGDKLSGSSAKMQFYDRIDRPFRMWLESIDPENDDIDDKTEELDKTVFMIAKKLGNELASQAGDSAVFGRYIKPDSKSKTKVVTSSAHALNIFMASLTKIFGKGGDKNEQSR